MIWSLILAVDVFLLVDGQPRHRYESPGLIACQTDSALNLAYPKGTVLKCEPVKPGDNRLKKGNKP